MKNAIKLIIGFGLISVSAAQAANPSNPCSSQAAAVKAATTPNALKQAQTAWANCFLSQTTVGGDYLPTNNTNNIFSIGGDYQSGSTEDVGFVPVK